MEDATMQHAAFDEAVVFLSYPLDEVLLLSLLAVLAGSETFVDIALFGDKKLDFLRRLHPFANGTPAHDHLGEIFAARNLDAFQRCFVAWVAAATGIPSGVIAIDGKTVRRSHAETKGKVAVHMVSAFAARQRMVLGQVKILENSNGCQLKIAHRCSKRKPIISWR